METTAELKSLLFYIDKLLYRSDILKLGFL